MTRDDVNPMSRRSNDQFRPPARAHPSHAEGTLTRLLEQQTAKIPSSFFLAGALAALAGSLLLQLTGHSQKSRFVGMWPPTLLALGLYNKLVKTFGTT